MLRINGSFENPIYNLTKDSKKVLPIEPGSKVKNNKKEKKSYQKTLKKEDNRFENILKDKEKN